MAIINAKRPKKCTKYIMLKEFKLTSLIENISLPKHASGLGKKLLQH